MRFDSIKMVLFIGSMYKQPSQMRYERCDDFATHNRKFDEFFDIIDLAVYALNF